MKDMTQGGITKHFIGFALPLILGNFFQLTYNAVDSIILGRWAGTESLAAAGTANPIMNIMIFFIVGISWGAGVLISEFYGAKDFAKLKREISTTLSVGFAFTLTVSILCFVFTQPLLRLVRTPEQLIAPAAHYLRIVFAGLLFTFFYNMFAATLRAVGDSRIPIVCVAVSAVCNGLLDFVLVALWGLGITGAAVATVTAQALSALLCIGYVYRRERQVAVYPRDFRFDSSLLGRTVNYSLAAAMQQTVLYVGKLVVQGAVNPLGVDSIAAFNAGTKIDDFAFQPTQSIGQAMTTFTAQNRGAGKQLRMQQGLRRGLVLSIVYGLAIGAAVALLRGRLMWLFAGKDGASVLDLGSSYLLVMASLYIMPALTNALQGFVRGLGIMLLTVASTTVQMLSRAVFALLLAPDYGIAGVAAACGLGWAAMLLFETPFIARLYRRLRS